MQGTWEFDYSIIPHNGSWKNSFSDAYAFETPLRLMSTGIHPGILPEEMSFLQVSPSTFSISAVQQAEHGNGWIVRGFNMTSEVIHASLKPWRVFPLVTRENMLGRSQGSLHVNVDGSISFPVRAHEIITIHFSDTDQ
jgi:alpha-mannosidase